MSRAHKRRVNLLKLSTVKISCLLMYHDGQEEKNIHANQLDLAVWAMHCAHSAWESHLRGTLVFVLEWSISRDVPAGQKNLQPEPQL